MGQIGKINRRSPRRTRQYRVPDHLGQHRQHRGARPARQLSRGGKHKPLYLLAFFPASPATRTATSRSREQGSIKSNIRWMVLAQPISALNGPQREMFPSAESISEMKVQGSGAARNTATPPTLLPPASRAPTHSMDPLFEYFQNAALDATRFTIPLVPKAAKSANTFGGSIGGPIFEIALSFLATTKACVPDSDASPGNCTQPGHAKWRFQRFSVGNQMRDTGDQPCLMPWDGQI